MSESPATIKYLAKYCQYIKNTGRVPLRVVMFDEDWDPIGPQVREQLLVHKLITQEPLAGIRLTEKGQDLA